jgi:hypothetical protein
MREQPKIVHFAIVREETAPKTIHFVVEREAPAPATNTRKCSPRERTAYHEDAVKIMCGSASVV